METATRRYIGGVERIATENHALALHARIGVWHSRDQGLRVGVLWRVENGLRRPLLHNNAKIHYRHLISDMFHDRKIMRDEDIGEAEFRLEIDKQVQNLGLDGDIQSRNRLIQN